SPLPPSAALSRACCKPASGVGPAGLAVRPSISTGRVNSQYWTSCQPSEASFQSAAPSSSSTRPRTSQVSGASPRRRFDGSGAVRAGATRVGGRRAVARRASGLLGRLRELEPLALEDRL